MTATQDTLAGIENGTILVSNSQWGSSFARVCASVTDRWGNHLSAVRLNGEAAGEFVSVDSVEAEDYRGIGWKLATADELRQMNRERDC